MGNPITPPAPSAPPVPAKVQMHNLLQELVPAPATTPAPAPAPAAPDVRLGTAPTSTSDLPVPAKQVPAAPEAAPAPAAEAVEFDLSALGLAEIPDAPPSEALDMTTSRGQQIWADHKLLRALEQPSEKGGLGYRPTLEQIRGMADDSRAHNSLILDLQSTTKSRNIAAVNWLLGLAPQAFLDLAAALPPSMLKIARERVLAAEVEAVLDIARKFPDNDQYRTQRKYWFEVANGLHFSYTGGQTLDPQILHQAPKPVETAEELLRRREEEITQREQAQARQQFDTWRSEIITRRETAIRDMVTQVVKPIKASDAVKALAVDAIVSRTLGQLTKNTQVMDQITILLRKTEAAMANPDQVRGYGDQIIDLYIRAASPIIRQQVAESVKSTTSATAAAAAADAVKAKQVSGDPTPAGSPTAPGGAPQAGQPGQPRARQKGETDQQYIQSIISDRLRN